MELLGLGFVIGSLCVLGIATMILDEREKELELMRKNAVLNRCSGKSGAWIREYLQKYPNDAKYLPEGWITRE